MTEPVTLDNCAREPIHIPGAIQPHGILVACRGADMLIQQVSENLHDWAGISASDVAGRPFANIITVASATELADAMRNPILREISPIRLVLANGAEVDASLHHSGDVVIVELERPVTSPSLLGFDPRLRASVVRMQHAATVRELCQIAAMEVRSITGFDRVMVYRFDADWNGEVVAEDKRYDLEPFLNQHYPASDIPEQARRLYTINWLRFIADVDYVPSPLVPLFDPATRAPLDLSHAALRSVSPIHIQYLKNMRVRASMSVSLVVDGVLAGLIACHHYSGPRLVDTVKRDTAEFLGQSLSWQLRVLEGAELSDRTRAAQLHESAVVRSVVSETELLDGLLTSSLLKLVSADGAAGVLADGRRGIGNTPTPEQLDVLVEWLHTQASDVVATDQISLHIPAAIDWSIAGVVAVALSREMGEYLIWFRVPTERTVDWAGNPHKAVTASDDGQAGQPDRLSPRGSFALWREIVKGRSLPWERWQVDAASNLRRVLLGGVRKRAVELRMLNDRLVESDRVKDSFIATVSHELRTPLNAIAGWTQLLQSGSLAPPRAQHALEVIARNADAQAQIIDDLLDVSRITSGKVTLDVEQVDLPALVEGVLDAQALAINAKDLRLKKIIDPAAGPVLGDPTRLRQILINLVGNAIKFTPKGGSITIVLHRIGSDIEIGVRDTGKGIAPAFLPHIFEPFRQQDEGMNRRSQGLGLGLAIVRKLVELHGGRIYAESDGEGRGALFRVQIPMAPVRITPTDMKIVEPASATGTAVLADLRVLVVEDETDARDLLVHLLSECGATVSAAGDAQAALALLGTTTFDVMVSDIGLPGMDGLEMMRQIRRSNTPARGLPAVALTAYTRAIDRTRVIQAGFQAHVPKPVDQQELLAIVASVVGRI